MNRSQFEVQVLVNGKPVYEITHEGKTFIEGRIGTQYTLRVKNNSWQRVMAVISVDGINVVTGKPAVSEDTGYILSPYNSMEIKGFRQDLSTVGAFKFCQRSQSYCNQAGAPGNNGVIGVRVYGEKIKPVVYKKEHTYPTMTSYYPPVYPPYDTMIRSSLNTGEDTNSATYSYNVSHGNTNNSESFGIGTTWGESVQDSVTMVEFETGDMLAEFELYYVSNKGLSKLGVPIKREKQVAFPKAFDGFAKPPSGWRG